MKRTRKKRRVSKPPSPAKEWAQKRWELMGSLAAMKGRLRHIERLTKEVMGFGYPYSFTQISSSTKTLIDEVKLMNSYAKRQKVKGGDKNG